MTIVRLRTASLAILLALATLTGAGRTLRVAAGDIAAGGVVSPGETALTLEGTLNAADLNAITHTCRSLESLDLSHTKITPYSGTALASNHSSYPADELPAFTLSALTAKKLQLPAGITAIADGALLSSAIESIEIPASVTSIGRGAFADCRNLKKITIHSSVSSLGSHAFKGCTALTEVICDTPTIPEAAFANCPKLKTVTLGGPLTVIDDEAFNGCRSLSEINFANPTHLTTIGEGAFAATAPETLNLSSCTALHSIGGHAFAGCSNLREVRLPESLSSIGEGIFSDCPALSSISFPEGITIIPTLALKGDQSLTDLSGVLHERVSAIGPLAFAGVNSAEKLTLHSGLTSIGSGAFEGWAALGSVIADELKDLPALGSDVWLGVDCSSVDLYVNEAAYPLFAVADQWKDFRITVYKSGLSTPEADATAADGLNIALRPQLLSITASRPMASAAIFDTEGRMVYGADTRGADTFSAEPPVTAGKIYIVSVRFADGSASAAKLLVKD